MLLEFRAAASDDVARINRNTLVPSTDELTLRYLIDYVRGVAQLLAAKVKPVLASKV